MAAQHPTHVERRETFPLTPSTPGTQDITAARPVLEGPSVRAPREIRALSASEDPQAALEMVRKVREQGTEYDRLVGQTLDGRYYVERKIGEGGMGVVFAARHAVIERPLAIKVLKREVMRDTATIKRFVKEAQAASRIGHPNIVDVTDFGTTPDGMTFSVMEYIEGTTLGAALRASGPFAATRAIRITTQIARALAAAHDKGIVHRDLKPENVFLLERDNRPDFVKIVDFGIAKVAPTSPADANQPRLTRAGSVFGTPEYMAPEQAAGRSDTDGRVDIYALGVILYEMLTGRVPHKGESMVRTLAMQMLDPIDPPRKARPDLDISPELEAIVMTALAKKRDQRYPTMTDFIAALEKLQTHVGSSLTGSPVYVLTPIPPGADSNLIPTAKNLVAPSVELVTPRARTPTSRVKDEPEFVTTEKPITFEHVFTDAGAPAQKRLWPFVLLFVLILAAAGGAIALVIRSRSHATTAPRDAGVFAVIPDAAPADATAIVPVSDDASLDIVVVVDAGRVIARVRDAAIAADAAIATPNGRGTLAIQVITRPEDATLYNGTTYTGPGGSNVEMPFGSKLELTCKKTGYKPGKVQLVFDGSMEIALCSLQRVKICIDNIKNPFDDCEIDPTKPVPPSPIDEPTLKP
jgi:serine/threonine protein kinase